MRILKVFPIALCAVVLCAAMATGAKADEWNKKTIVTFTNSVEIPGQVLEPGTYVFKMMDSPSNRNTVQIWTGDGDHLLATIKTISDYHPQPNDKSVFVLDESSGGPTAMLQSWFYAGDISGQRFIYPKYPTTQEAMNTNTAH